VKFQVPRTKFQGRQTNATGAKSQKPKARPPRILPKFQVKPDFVFPKLKLAVFVDGCFLAWVPEAFHQAEGKRGVLAEENSPPTGHETVSSTGCCDGTAGASSASGSMSLSAGMREDSGGGSSAR